MGLFFSLCENWHKGCSGSCTMHCSAGGLGPWVAALTAEVPGDPAAFRRWEIRPSCCRLKLGCSVSVCKACRCCFFWSKTYDLRVLSYRLGYHFFQREHGESVSSVGRGRRFAPGVLKLFLHYYTKISLRFCGNISFNILFYGQNMF